MGFGLCLRLGLGLRGETTLQQVGREIAQRATFLEAAAFQISEGAVRDRDGNPLGRSTGSRLSATIRGICIGQGQPPWLKSLSCFPVGPIAPPAS